MCRNVVVVAICFRRAYWPSAKARRRAVLSPEGEKARADGKDGGVSEKRGYYEGHSLTDAVSLTRLGERIFWVAHEALDQSTSGGS